MGCFVVAEFLLTDASHDPSAIAELLVHICTACVARMYSFWLVVVNHCREFKFGTQVSCS